MIREDPVVHRREKGDLHVAAVLNVTQELDLMAKFAIIMLGLLLMPFHPVQAVHFPESVRGVPVNVVYAGLDYRDLSYLVSRGFTKRAAFKMVDLGMKVLERQTLPSRPPPAWIYVHVSDERYKATFVHRSDNLYSCGLINYWDQVEDDAIGMMHALKECRRFFPGSVRLGFGGSYRELYGGRDRLKYLNINRETAKEASRVISQYHHKISDPFEMMDAYTLWTVIISEGQRFSEVDNCLIVGWETNCHLKRPKELLINWATLSCGLLENWSPSRRRRSEAQYAERLQKYADALNTLRITKEEAPRLLRVLIMGTECENNIKGRRERVPP